MNWFLDNWHKFIFCSVLIACYFVGTSIFFENQQKSKVEQSVDSMAAGKFESTPDQRVYDLAYAGLGVAVAIACFLVFIGDLRRWIKGSGMATVFLIAVLPGCRRPFEPVKLEVIKSNEEAFLLPLIGDGKKQAHSDNEKYLKENLVYSQQVKIPQQWVPAGYETWGYNGSWKDAAVLIRVDKSPVTREWTASPDSGTSNKNEAVWVMTSDQVEFSTGWTITARIESRDDAVKFLHNYPNGSLKEVMDSEVRSKLQAVFGLEVTDLPMKALRDTATPHIEKTTKEVTGFFKNRGISITNLGITGGFVYKDKTILETMVKVFNADQMKAIAESKTRAQIEENKAIVSKSEGEADAILKTKKAEADGIKMVAEARLFELEKTKENWQTYFQLKQLELQKELLHKWDGSFPKYFMGSGQNQTPQMLLQLPAIESKK